MDFEDSIRRIADRVEKLCDKIPTEEATKHALVMPFLTALGYDVSNPSEVLPEMPCGIGMKKGEKIDYAILRDEKPVILVECKHWKQNLAPHENQLLRYFGVSTAKFGILTNGIKYQFYTDLEKPNIMDFQPFLSIDLRDLRDEQIDELKKFHKSCFDADMILNSAKELRCLEQLKDIISEEFSNPSLDFVKFLKKKVHVDAMWSSVTKFTPLVKKGHIELRKRRYSWQAERCDK